MVAHVCLQPKAVGGHHLASSEKLNKIAKKYTGNSYKLTHSERRDVCAINYFNVWNVLYLLGL